MRPWSVGSLGDDELMCFFLVLLKATPANYKWVVQKEDKL